MNNSIQYFLENGIPGLEKIKKDFFTNPICFDEYIENVKNIMPPVGMLSFTRTRFKNKETEGKRAGKTGRKFKVYKKQLAGDKKTCKK